jgi:UDP-glucuronate 4-epimerase
LTILITGAAGFIGARLAEVLLARGERVVGVDVFNTYYDPALKAARAARLDRQTGFSMVRMDIAENAALAELVRTTAATTVVHLAAQAGVRYSIKNPFAYERSNLAGHLSVLEACRHAPNAPHLVYASSSSVYGDRPISGSGFREDDPAEAPVSLYAATKRSGELMSGAYTRLYGMAQTGLRFFTVYGPYGRPDMAYFGFTQKILAGEPIEVFGEGRMARDFTYIDDIVDGVVRALDRPATGTPPHKLYNLGNHRCEKLTDFLAEIERALQKKAIIEPRPLPPGDVLKTYADIEASTRDLGFEPTTPITVGIPKFIAWYREFYRA